MISTEKIALLVTALQNGDQQAFADIYDMYSDSLYGLVLKIVRDEGLAQDILQDCFINIWKKAGSYSSAKGSFFTWMLNICRNKSIDELRKLGRIQEGQIQMEHSNVYMMKGAETAVDTIGLNELIQKLPEEQQLILDFIYFRGYTQQEVSDELNIPLGTVKTRTRNALIGLREHFTIIILLWIFKHT